MKYLAILGRQPELGIAELEALFGSANIQQFGLTGALLKTAPDINELGGTIKVGRVLYQGASGDINEIPLDINELPLRAGKTNFGLSYYGIQATPRFVNRAGITLKKRLQKQGSVRFVAPQTGLALTAAQVKFNGLIRNGFELLILVHKQKMVVAITEQIQDIDWYATRDYQRPTRSAKVGMLPPKLAQIMVNTTSAPVVYDPFCGTGVVLQEALLLGRIARGSDVVPDMVSATQDNLTWLTQQRSDLANWSAAEADARNVALPAGKLAIVSEGYLGPNMSSKPSVQQLEPIITELQALYRDSLANWASQIDSGTEVTLTAPIWQTPDGWKPLGIVDLLPDLGYTLRQFAHVKSNALIYRRPNQFVGRQLLILRKQ